MSCAAVRAPTVTNESTSGVPALGFNPSADSAIATVIGSYVTLDETQRRSVGAIVGMYLAAEKLLK